MTILFLSAVSIHVPLSILCSTVPYFKFAQNVEPRFLKFLLYSPAILIKAHILFESFELLTSMRVSEKTLRGTTDSERPGIYASR